VSEEEIVGNIRHLIEAGFKVISPPTTVISRLLPSENWITG
jgi:hypothetical protein